MQYKIGKHEVVESFNVKEEIKIFDHDQIPPNIKVLENHLNAT